MFDPMERVVAAFGRQLDPCATPFAPYKKWAKEVGERVILETLFALLLRCRFWSPVDKAKTKSWRIYYIKIGKDPYFDESCDIGFVGVIYTVPCRAVCSVVFNGRESCIIRHE